MMHIKLSRITIRTGDMFQINADSIKLGLLSYARSITAIRLRPIGLDATTIGTTII